MKSKTPLILIEQVILILFFTVSAAISLKSFAFSEKLSETVQKQDLAILYASNVAEVVKYYCGDFNETSSKLGGKTENGILTVCFSEYSNGVEVKAKKTETGINGLGKAEIRAYIQGEENAFIEVCWQEDDSR